MDVIQDLCAVKSAPGLLNCLPVLRQNHLTQVPFKHSNTLARHRCHARVFDSRFIVNIVIIINNICQNVLCEIKCQGQCHE